VLTRSINLPKYILTNADRKHATLCLERLGIQDCFAGVFDFEWAQEAAKAKGLLTPSSPVMCKPSKQVHGCVGPGGVGGGDNECAA
jgi:putative hydrolase of the HAD superfamily/pyrimidine and pyridine-specific 5'-nucleotidase